MNNQVLINAPRKVHELPDAKCACKIDPPKQGAARNILQQWLRDHPVHTRKEHLGAKENFKWLENRLSLRDSRCLG